MSVEFVSCEEAKARGGLRLVTVGGIPSPWSEAAKGILHVKKIPHVGVRLLPGDPAVSEWTGDASAPVAMFEDEAPRGGWAEILLLAERLSPEPALIPEDPELRALLFGWSHEICGEMGLGWCRRLAGIHASIDTDGAEGFPRGVGEYLAGKYGYHPENGSEVRRRVVELLGMLAGRLHSQEQDGSVYYLGSALTALDIYSAAFTVLFKPLPEAQCPMPAMIRAGFEWSDADTAKAFDPILIAHRDRIYRDHLELPLTL